MSGYPIIVFVLSISHMVGHAWAEDSGPCDLTTCPSLVIQDLPDLQNEVSHIITDPVYDLVRLTFTFPGGDPSVAMRTRGQDDTFDPQSWAWVGARAKVILQTPYDYRWVSLGLLTLREKDIKVKFSPGNGPKCVIKLPGKCRDKVFVAYLKSALSKTEISKSSHICRMAYTHATLTGKDQIGVGMKCCSSTDLANSATTGTTCDRILDDNVVFQKNIPLAFSILLAVFVYLRYFGWQRFALLHLALKGRSWDWLGKYFGFGNNCYHAFIMRASNGEAQQWVQLSDEELIGGNTSLSQKELWLTLGGTHRSSRIIPIFKILLLTFLVNIVAFYFIPHYYEKNSSQMSLMETGDEVAFNLRDIPISWWTTEKDSWAKIYSIIVLTGVEINFLIDFIVSLVFCFGFREKPMKAPAKYLSAESGQGWRKLKSKLRKSSANAVCLALLLTVLHMAITFFMMAGVSYSLCNVFMYVAIAISYNSAKLLPWFVTFIMLLYYTYDTYEGIKTPYNDIKNILFEEYLHSGNNFIIAHTFEDYYKHLKDEEKRKKEPEVEQVGGVKLEKMSRKRLIRVRAVFLRSRKPRILLDHFLDISDHLVGKIGTIGSAIFRIVLLYIYGFLLVFTLTAFLPEENIISDTLEGMIASVINLVLLLVPLWNKIHICSRERTTNIRLTQWRFEIKRYLRHLLVELAEDTAQLHARRQMDAPVFGRRQIQQVDEWLQNNEYFFEDRDVIPNALEPATGHFIKEINPNAHVLRTQPRYVSGLQWTM